MIGNDTREVKSVLAHEPQEGEPWDVAIIGSGPSALTAAIYTTRGSASTIILGGEKWGGQLMLTTTVDNFPGMIGIQGPDLMTRMREHATAFGGKFLAKNVTEVELGQSPFELVVDTEKIFAKSVIVATGADTKWLGVPGESELIGRGVSSCAPCDAPFFKNKKVVIVGGGDSAMEEALVLSKYASETFIVHRRDSFRASAAMQSKVLEEEKKGKIKIIWNTEVVEVVGRDKLEKLVLKNVVDGKTSEMETDGMFVAIGHIPLTNIFKGKIQLDDKDYVKKMEQDGFHMATNIPGVFVAGDVHDLHYKQAITAAAFGCMAGMEVLKYLDKSVPSW